jgi:hypothetical protein
MKTSQFFAPFSITSSARASSVGGTTIREVEVAFAAIVRERFDALFVMPDAFFNSRRVQLATLAARLAP